MPARSGGRFRPDGRTLIRIGIRWTTLTQFPLVFWAGSRENSWAAAGLMLSTTPRQVAPG